MNINNTTSSYGWLSILLHWLTALVVFLMFGLGLWMDSLGYYDPLYQVLPDLHKSIGVVLVLTVLGRFFWRLSQPRPTPVRTHTPWERRMAHFAHIALYTLIFLMLPTGYFISTADGRSLDIFGLISIPALITSVDNLEDFAGEVHEILAFSLIGLAVLHALAALKHHFIDKDVTLKRMLKPPVSKTDC